MYLATLFDLDSRVRQQHDSIPSDFGDGTSIQMLVGEGLCRSAFHIHSIYYVCMIFLHASVVPVLSGSAANKGLSPLVTKLSATTALSNAFAFAKMAKEYLRTQPDFTKLPPFVGYCAFVAGSVLNAAGVHLAPKAANQNHEGSLVCAAVLQELSVYWPVFHSFVCPILLRWAQETRPPTPGQYFYNQFINSFTNSILKKQWKDLDRNQQRSRTSTSFLSEANLRNFLDSLAGSDDNIGNPDPAVSIIEALDLQSTAEMEFIRRPYVGEKHLSDSDADALAKTDPATIIQEMNIPSSDNPDTRCSPDEGGSSHLNADATASDFMAGFGSSAPDFDQYHSTWLGQIYGLSMLDP